MNEEKTMEFRIIPGFSDYEISHDGETIRRLTYSPNRRLKAGHVMKQRLRPDGYKQVLLTDDAGEQKNLRVHRLVAAAFIGGPADKQINHKDGVKTNNTVENLEIVSHKENMAHSRSVLGNKHGAVGERNGNSKLKESDIPEILERRGRGETYTSIASDYGVARQTIGDICTGRYWKPVGYMDKQ